MTDVLPRMAPDLLRSLLPFMTRPISPQRWARRKVEIIAELHERAARNGSTPEEELYLAAAAAARIAQLEGRSETPRQSAEWVIWYRRRIQDLVTVDLLGPDWRERERYGDGRPSAVSADEPDPLRELEASSELERLLEQVTDAEREYLELWFDLIADGWDRKEARREAGRRTGRNPNAVRQLVFRIRRNVSRFSAD